MRLKKTRLRAYRKLAGRALANNVDGTGVTIRDELRIYTRDVHQQLHEHSHFEALFDGTIERTQYCDLMRAFFGFYAPLERALDIVLPEARDERTGFHYAERLNFLRRDLAFLGDSPAEIDRLPICSAIFDLVRPDSLAGVLYVVEGATLGASQIDRAAQKILSSETLQGRRFWAWSRANNKIRWAAISAFLEELDQTNHPRDAILRGASDTFQALADWMTPLNLRESVDEGKVL